MKKVLSFAIMAMFLLSFTSAMTIDFFYSNSCPHCQQVKPLMNEMVQKFPDKEINFYDVAQGSYDVPGVPTIRIKTDDCRNIELIGTNEIDKYLFCELQEMSTEECMTHNYLKRGSYFIE